VFEIMDIKSDITDAADAVVLENTPNTIEFNQVYMKYEKKEDYVLQDINFKVKKGEKAAIVGPTGAGKSSMMDLLLRFYDPDNGAVLFDGTDIKKFSLKSLRDKIAIVTQDVFLFNDTIANNITFGEKISIDKIKAAASAAYASDFIEGLPQKYDTIIGDRGIRLSGGERQRISIARAILKNAPILILDEATSSLDSIAEQVVGKAIDSLIKDRTVFIIAHRLSTVKGADFIIVLNNGKIEKVGSHESLLKNNKLYNRLYTLQYAG